MNEGISRREFLGGAAAGVTMLTFGRPLAAVADRDERPNIIFIMADDLGYGDCGCYGQQKIRTPHIDTLAREGTRFTQCYAGSTVCAPSRSVLMTGQHTGHTRVRGNMCIVGGTLGDKAGRPVRRMHLTAEDVTVADVLRKADYRTGLVGKWHLGGYSPDAGPLDRGFDEFYGWLTRTPETIEPTYWPAKRYRNRDLIEIEANRDGRRGYYHTDICTNEAIDFLKRNRDRRFFLYVAHVGPHDPLDAPDVGPYANEDWPDAMKTYAAMVDRVDASIGRLMRTLKDLDLDGRTIVFFCSDNGPRSSGAQTLTEVAEFFDSNGPLTGYKRDMYEGGIRVPMLVRWPGHIPAQTAGDAVWYFADVLPTLADVAGVKPPDGIDGISVLDILLGKKQDTQDRFLYWEFFERGFQQAVRWRQWKAIRLKPHAPLLLFDLSRDVEETHDVAQEHPQVVSRVEAYLAAARTESANWPL